MGLSPLVGWKITDAFSLGVQFTYQSIKGKTIINGVSRDANEKVIGLRGFSRYKIIDNVFAHIEYESLNYKFNGNEKESYNAFLVGGGYSESVGGSAALYAIVLYNLDYSANTSFYTTPLVTRLGITFGF